jgi:hypothetical protein
MVTPVAPSTSNISHGCGRSNGRFAPGAAIRKSDGIAMSASHL